MTKDVLVSIAGLHDDMQDENGGAGEVIEILNPGTYYQKDGKHYIFFEEQPEGSDDTVRTQIRIQDSSSVEVIKKGALGMNMLYENGKKNRGYYMTPYGRLNLGIYTTDIFVEDTGDNLNVRVDYIMDVDYEPVAECRIRINVKSRESKGFSIRETMDF